MYDVNDGNITRDYENYFTVAFNSDFEKFDLIVNKDLMEILALYKDKLLVFNKEYGDNEFTIAIGYGPKSNTLKIYDDEET